MPRSPTGTHLTSYFLFQGIQAFSWTQSFFYTFPLRIIPFSKYSSFLLVCCVFNCVQLFVIPWNVALQAPLSMEFSGKNTAVGCHFLLQGIFPTQGSNPGLLHCRRNLLPLSHLGSLLRSKLKLSLSVKGSGCFDTGSIVSTTQVLPRKKYSLRVRSWDQSQSSWVWYRLSSLLVLWPASALVSLIVKGTKRKALPYRLLVRMKQSYTDQVFSIVTDK